MSEVVGLLVALVVSWRLCIRHIAYVERKEREAAALRGDVFVRAYGQLHGRPRC